MQFRSLSDVLCSVIAVVTMTTGQAALAAATQTPATAYVGGSVLNTSGDGWSNATILVRGAKIDSIAGSSAATPEGVRIVHVDGQYIIPGLINSHVHLATLANPNDARAYLRRELHSGVTMVRDMAGDVRLIAELKREASQDEIDSPDVYYAALFAGASFFTDPRTHAASLGIEPGKAPWMQAITAATDLPRAVAEAKGTGATGIKLYADMPAPLIKAIAAEAHRQNLLVWSHAAIFPARPSDVVDAGVDVMSHADFIAFQSDTPFPESFKQATHTDHSHWRMTPAEQSVLSAMKKQSIVLDATVDVGFRYPVKNWPSFLATQLARAAHQQGIAISAGTDDDPPDLKEPDSALLSEIERLVHDVGMTTVDALRAATVVGARTIGEQDSAGVLAAGRVANFVVLRADPLRNIHNLHSVALVVKHGIVYPRPNS